MSDMRKTSFAELVRDETGADNQRRAERKPLDVRVEFRKRSYRTSRADLIDISSTGFLHDLSVTFSTGEAIWLNLPGLETLEARVVRVDDFRIGCQFVRPIPDYVFEGWLKKTQR